MNTDEFIPYNQSLELKNLGFNDECNAYYYPSQIGIGWDLVQTEIPERNSTLVIGVTAPTWMNGLLWLHSNYNWNFHIYSLWEGGYYYYINQLDGEEINDGISKYDTYEDAIIACLNKLIQTVKTI
jgi:hypothetical protein